VDRPYAHVAEIEDGAVVVVLCVGPLGVVELIDEKAAHRVVDALVAIDVHDPLHAAQAVGIEVMGMDLRVRVEMYTGDVVLVDVTEQDGIGASAQLGGAPDDSHRRVDDGGGVAAADEQ
jgi:hypothetical protein